MKLTKQFSWKTVFVLFLILLFAAACTTSSEEGDMTEEEMEHTDGEMDHTEEEMEHDDHDHQDEHVRVPNNDAAVHITSPADGAIFKVGDEVTVGIELENFELGDGNHWHIYVDGTSWGMVMGENTDDTLRGLEAGEHEIGVHLSIDTHEELEDGDTITILVEE